MGAKDVIAPEDFGPESREKTVGHSLYRICRNEESGSWFVSETYSVPGDFAMGSGYYSRDLREVIDAFNGISGEREIVGRAPEREGD